METDKATEKMAGKLLLVPRALMRAIQVSQDVYGTSANISGVFGIPTEDKGIKGLFTWRWGTPGR